MRKYANKGCSTRGFSLIELMIVLVISMVVAAFALPNILNAAATFRLRSSVSGLAGLMQRARIEAVRTNNFIITRLGTSGNAQIAYVDVNNNQTISAGEAQVAFQNVKPDYTGPTTAFPSSTLLGYSQAASGSPFAIGFNARGLPCTPTPASGATTGCSVGNITTTAGSTAGFLYYFKIATTFGDRWAAITVTPAGRIHVWVLNGSTWS